MRVNKEKENDLDHAELVRRMAYKDGKLYWAVTEGRWAVSGKRAGTPGSRGYRFVWIKGNNFLEHRVIWFYENGEWPDGVIDHINRDQSDNRIENLRDVDLVINQRNRGPQKNNTSGHKGVSLRPAGGYTAQIVTKGKKQHIGCYDTLEEAVAARTCAERRYWK